MSVTLRNVGAFGVRVLRDFSRNKGLLLAGAVGYNALLSTIPLFAVVIGVLSHFVDGELLLRILTRELRIVVPGQEVVIAEALVALVEERELVSGIGLVVLLFFSSIAFRILEDAMAIIFHRRRTRNVRHPIISALIPFVYIMSIGIALLFLTIVTAWLEAASGNTIRLWNWEVQVGDWTAVLLGAAGFLGSVAVLTSFYVVMPVAKVRWRLALVGGAVAAVLWEIVRRFLVWYFASLSLINAIYGSLATVVVVLLCMEVAALIVLLGAQVIAELERTAEAGLKWYETPPADPEGSASL